MQLSLALLYGFAFEAALDTQNVRLRCKIKVSRLKGFQPFADKKVTTTTYE